MAMMPVVVATDGSEESLRAVEWAITEAVRHGAPLRIVSAPAMPPRMHVYDTAPQTAANALRGSPAARSMRRSHGQEESPRSCSSTLTC